MSRTVVLLLGIIAVLGALLLANQRHGDKIRGAGRERAAVSVQAERQQPGQPRAAQNRPQTPQAAPVTTASSTSTFEMLINVMNVLVGIAGIYMTWMGMRMQKAALNKRP